MNPAAPRILIVKLGALGDVLLALPAARLLRAALPEARVAWLVEARHRSVLGGNREVDEVLVARGDIWRHALLSPRTWREIGELVASLRGARFDVALDLQGLFKSALWTRVSGAPCRLGLPAGITRERGASWAMTERGRALPERSHVTEHYLELARAAVRWLGADPPPPIRETGCVTVLPALRAWARATLQTHGLSGRLVVVNPGAGWVTKRWPAPRFSELTKRLAGELGVAVFVAHGPDERDLAHAIVADARSPGVATFPSDVGELGAILEQASLFVGGDTGPYHLARDLGVPTVALFGATDPSVNGPRGPRDDVLWGEAPCRPCYKRTCPTAIECMSAITVAEVLSACERRLSADSVPAVADHPLE